MIPSLIQLLFVALVLYVIFWVVCKFIQGVAVQIIGLILALVFLSYALKALHFHL